MGCKGVKWGSKELKMAQNEPKMAQNRVKIGLKWCQNGSTRVSTGSACTQMAPRCACMGPTGIWVPNLMIAKFGQNDSDPMCREGVPYAYGRGPLRVGRGVQIVCKIFVDFL